MQKEQDRIYNHLKNQGYSPCRIKIDHWVKCGGNVSTANFQDLCESPSTSNMKYNPYSNPTRVSNGDEYTVPKHKHLQKLIDLEDRIARWKHVGDACTEKQWDQASKDLDHVTKTRRAISADPDYVIPKFLLREFNSMWKVYATKAGTPLDKIMGGINWSQIANKIGEKI